MKQEKQTISSNELLAMIKNKDIDEQALIQYFTYDHDLQRLIVNTDLIDDNDDGKLIF